MTQLVEHICGIDFGSQQSGNTVAAFMRFGKIVFHRSIKNKSSDDFLMILIRLTARAMRLKSLFPQIDFHESYPGGLARHLKLAELEYKKSNDKIPAIIHFLENESGLKVSKQEELSWHHVDALLTFIISQRYFIGKHKVFGNEAEGQIIY